MIRQATRADLNDFTSILFNLLADPGAETQIRDVRRSALGERLIEATLSSLGCLWKA